MSVSVTVTGMPGDTKFPKILYSFKGLLKKIQIKKFWIRDLTDMYDSDCKQMTVEFSNKTDARKARNYFNNMPYTQGQSEYLLMAHINEEQMPMEYYQEERDWGQPRRSMKRGRPRSRSPSPGYRREANKLDMEIELLRKQRQVIEEERRLLLEQKKLEMIREFGPSVSQEFGPGVSQEFDHFEPPRKRHHPSKSVEVKAPRKRSPPLPKVPKIPKIPNTARNARKGLPLFIHACRVLIAEMKPYIEKDTTPEEIEILVKLIRAAIRKNLAIALEGKDYMPTKDQLVLYRELHPKTTDGALVAKILKNIRASYLPNELDIKPVVKSEQVKAQNEVDKEPSLADVKVENKSDNSVVEENPDDKQAVNDDTEPQENLEENVKDAPPVDGDVNLKSEPDVSQELVTPDQNETSAEQSTMSNDNFWMDVEGCAEFAKKSEPTEQ